MKSLLIGEAAVQPNIEAIKEALTQHYGVVRIIDVRTQHIGPEELLVAGKIEFDPGLSTDELSRTIDEVEAAMRSSVDLEMQIYLEPDIYEDNHTDS
jgi:divalent metal cation (Fe/Co/Zn/Cd) transporter